MTRNKKKKDNKIVLLSRYKLISIESTIAKALIGNEISYKDFKTFINKDRNYPELKKSIKMMKSDTEKSSLIEDGKRKDIDQSIRQNERVNNNVKSQT